MRGKAISVLLLEGRYQSYHVASEYRVVQQARDTHDIVLKVIKP
jgi:hypothetical protein